MPQVRIDRSGVGEVDPTGPPRDSGNVRGATDRCRLPVRPLAFGVVAASEVARAVRREHVEPAGTPRADGRCLADGPAKRLPGRPATGVVDVLELAVGAANEDVDAAVAPAHRRWRRRERAS